MNKIYGFDDKLTFKLIDFIKNKKGEKLTSVFAEFATVTGKSAGTVRNLYYALCKKAESDSDFKEKYLSGIDFAPAKIERFSKDSERELLKKIMSEKLKTRSTRSAVYNLANGDGKLALRYQNKFRTAMKNNLPLINEIAMELSSETEGAVYMPNAVSSVTEFNINKLKGEINTLVEKIAYRTRRENEMLKIENARLKEEIERLNLLSSGDGINYIKAITEN